MHWRSTLSLLTVIVVFNQFAARGAIAGQRPHVVLVMADDQGWGQTSYNHHPILKTPNLDSMAANGLRFNRFYAGGPVCSPTRASVLTSRTHNRCGVRTHGYALHLQEKTVSQAMRDAGYATGHFGKWHLNGVRGPGIPVLADDPYHPGRFGFSEWLTVPNYFDRNPIMSRNGTFEKFQGDSSKIIVDEALKFISQHASSQTPVFTVIWYGSPHSPFVADSVDLLTGEDAESAHHHGELIAMDRSIGSLRKGLRNLGISENTLVWFCSENGGLPNVGHDSAGGLKGHKGSIWEGGLRVPGIIEWPTEVTPRISDVPAGVVDTFPTLLDVCQLPAASMLDVVDGVSIRPSFRSETGPRSKPLLFHYRNKAALIDNNLKLVTENTAKQNWTLFDLAADPAESRNVSSQHPADFERLRTVLQEQLASIDQSRSGADYPQRRVTVEGPHGRFWHALPQYQRYLDEWSDRPEYNAWLKKNRNGPQRRL